ncbi:tetrameric acyl-CoA thioesterase [Arthrobacter sp. MYb227]|uniref:YiiD C-terminal domain-containing protein n=1 Tax=Arthrobacter sp. MYb227 TaxID=1848601 RepID=UPI000CFCF92E|nr:YiiD C-terminal domain-containing protein [Arthrobacter sp. MYb227]PQZ90255.1 tetrameric acyl-CoA thioesterase [Arthrobacter sp. MYb227]
MSSPDSVKLKPKASILNSFRLMIPKVAGNPRVVKHGMSLWPPFWGAGIEVKEISADWRSATVIMRQRPWNMNYVGTHFGGSLFSMTDPFWMMMVLHNIGEGHIVWDKSAEISFLKPGHGTLRCNFRLDEAKLSDLRNLLTAQGKATMWFEVEIIDATGDAVARVRKEVYVRTKNPAPPKPNAAKPGYQ